MIRHNTTKADIMKKSTVLRSISIISLLGCSLVIHAVDPSKRAKANIASHKSRRHGHTSNHTTNQILSHRLSSNHDILRGGGFNNTKQPPAPTKASARVLQSMRMLYLTYYASLGALMPYLPVYFHSLGHSGSAIGILGAVKPLTTFLVAPLWGILSDRYGNHVSLLQFTFVSSLMFQLMVGWGINLNFLIASVFITALLNAPVKSLIDTVVMEKLTADEDRHQFGQLRLWGQIGFGVGSSVVGSLLSMFPAEDKTKAEPVKRPSFSFTTATAPEEVNHPTIEKVIQGIETGIEVACETDACAETAAVSTEKARNALFEMTKDLLGKKMGSSSGSFALKGYAWAFLMHGLLSIPTLLAIRAFRPEKQAVEVSKKNKSAEEPKKTDIGQGLRLLFQNSDALIFFFLVFVIGTSSGCIENFAYVRVREVGGTGNQMGMLRLVSSLAGAPMFWFSGPLTEYLGVDVVLVLSLLAYVARFFNYAYIHHPYHALPAEALRGITFALFWSSGSTYAHRISPPGMAATMLMLLNAMYGGLGQSLGAIIGGKMQTKLGTIGTFKYSGLFDLCFVAGLVAYLSTKKERAFASKSIQR
jgi:predicted MFS family arabinose efflux permease